MKRLILAFREAGLRFSRDGCSFLAQALAFNSLFTLFPLLVLVITAGSLIFPHSEQRALSFFGTFAPPLHGFLQSNLQSYIYGRGVGSVIALAFVIWSGKNLFMALTYALDRALGVPKGRPLVHDIALSIAMLPVVGIMLLVAMTLPVIMSIVIKVAQLPDRQHLTQIGGYVIAIALVFFVTNVLYTFLPNRRVRWRFAVPGAGFVAVTWPLLQFAFAQYTVHVNFTRIYGALSAPLVVLLWFYLIGSTFLFGAELSAGWAHIGGTEKVAELVDELDPTLERKATAR